MWFGCCCGKDVCDCVDGADGNVNIGIAGAVLPSVMSLHPDDFLVDPPLQHDFHFDVNNTHTLINRGTNCNWGLPEISPQFDPLFEFSFQAFRQTEQFFLDFPTGGGITIAPGPNFPHLIHYYRDMFGASLQIANVAGDTVLTLSIFIGREQYWPLNNNYLPGTGFAETTSRVTWKKTVTGCPVPVSSLPTTFGPADIDNTVGENTNTTSNPGILMDPAADLLNATITVAY